MSSNKDVINVLNVWDARNHGKKFPVRHLDSTC